MPPFRLAFQRDKLFTAAYSTAPDATFSAASINKVEIQQLTLRQHIQGTSANTNLSPVKLRPAELLGHS